MRRQSDPSAQVPEQLWRMCPLEQSVRIDSAAAPPIRPVLVPTPPHRADRMCAGCGEDAAGMARPSRAAAGGGGGAVLALAALIVGLLLHRRKEPGRTLSRSSG